MATENSQQSTAQIIAANNALFLKYGRTNYTPVITGQLASGNAGGSATSVFSLTPSDVPSVPKWLSALDVWVVLPVSLTLAAGESVMVSPLAPYSAINFQGLLAGANLWPSTTSLVPWWLDSITSGVHLDPWTVGPNITTSNPVSGSSTYVPPPTSWFNPGSAPTMTTLGNELIPQMPVLPGQTITNSGTSAETLNYTFIFPVRLQFQRRRSEPWGMIPLGSPTGRPRFIVQLNSLIGVQPENNLFVNSTNSNNSAVTGESGAEIYLVPHAVSLGLLPQGVNVNKPVVGLGLALNYNSQYTFSTAGSIKYVTHEVDMLYTAIYHILINNQNTIDPDYIGLWNSQEDTSARYSYDATAGNLQEYYWNVLETYGRYLPRGVVIYDMERGKFPWLPSVTPYQAYMSPSTLYAASAGVQATPNMATALRVPSGTMLSNCYVATYSFGLQTVPY